MVMKKRKLRTAAKRRRKALNHPTAKAKRRHQLIEKKRGGPALKKR